MVVHKAACHTLSKASWKSTKTWYRFCWCWRYFSERILRLKICSVELLPDVNPSFSSAIVSLAWSLSLFKMTFSMALLEWLIRLIVLQFRQGMSFLESVIISVWVHGVGHMQTMKILIWVCTVCIFLILLIEIAENKQIVRNLVRCMRLIDIWIWIWNGLTAEN